VSAQSRHVNQMKDLNGLVSILGPSRATAIEPNSDNNNCFTFASCGIDGESGTWFGPSGLTLENMISARRGASVVVDALRSEAMPPGFYVLKTQLQSGTSLEAQPTKVHSRLSIVAGVVSTEPIDLLEKSRRINAILNPAIQGIKSFSNHRLIHDAKAIIDKLYEALTEFDLNSINKLMPLKAYENSEDMDECILLEWIYPHWRIGFSIEEDKEDSSWFLVSDAKAGSMQAAGALSLADFKWIIDWGIRRNR